MIDALAQYDHKNRYSLFYRYPDYPLSKRENNRWTAVSAEDASLFPGMKGRARRNKERLLHALVAHNLLDPVKICVRPTLKGLFERYRANLMIYPTTTPISFEVRIPYIMTIHDLEHRFHPEFREVSAKGVQRKRECDVKYGCRYAQAIIVDNEAGKQDVLDYYEIRPERVFPLPHVSPTLIKQDVSADMLQLVRNKYGLPFDYVFYPAALHPHKNHLGLVKALYRIREKYGIAIPCVLAGPKAAAYAGLMHLIERLGMSEQVRYIGYVPDEDMAPLYRMALMLVMPTFFGPTNLPIVEAWDQKCPVITSEMRGIREEVGDAGLLIDPKDVEALAEAIYQVYFSPELRQVLITKGVERASKYGFENYGHNLISIVESVIERLKFE